MKAKEIVEGIKKGIFEMTKDHPVMVDQKAFNEIEQQINEHTNSKLNKIIKKVESQKETYAHCESDEEIWNNGLDRAITIIKKEITKNN